MAMGQGREYQSICRSVVPCQRSAATNRAPAAAGKNIKTAAAASPKSWRPVASHCHSERGRGISNRFGSIKRCLDSARHDKSAWPGQFVSRDLELVAVGIAEIDRVRDLVVLEFEFDSALFQ